MAIMKKVMISAVCVMLALGLAARDAPEWFEKGVVAQMPTAAATNMPALAARGVTIVQMQEEATTPAQAAAFTAAAHAAGLKALARCGCPAKTGDAGLFVLTNLVPRWVDSPADGWVVSGADRLPLETWELARQAVKGAKPGLVLVAEGSRLGNQCSAFDADFPPPWNAALNDVLKARQTVAELERLWRLMRENRPEGSRFLRGSPHWDPVPVAFAFALDGVPVLTAGQASGCSAVLPKLCALRAAEPAFTEGDLAWLENDSPEKVAAFVRTAPDGRRVVCVFNLRREALTVKVKLPAALADAPLLAAHCAYADGAYVFAGEGYDIRAVAGAVRTSAERTARAAALAAAETPRARNLELKDPVYRDLTNLTARAVPPYLRGAMMYQLFLRPFTPEGTLKAAEARLPFVKSLGTDILYLCPVATADRGTDPTYWSSRQKQSRLGNPCNPYRIADYFGIDPEYGTEQDLKDFVAAAHGLGMKVLFDVVYYHCGPNAVFLKDHPEWALRNPDGSFQLGEWAFPRLDVKNPAVREYFFENMAWYLREFQCDGFRCDVGGMLPLWYREEAYRRNKAVKDDVVMLCEGNDPREQQVAFDLCYAFPMQVAIRDFLAGKGSATNLSVNCVQREGRFPKGYHWMRCFQNHDYANCAPGQKRWEETYGLALNDALLVTLFTLDGVPMVYNGQEIADTAPHSIWSNRFHGKWGIDWSRAFTPEGAHRLDLVRALGRLRHDRPSLFDAPTEFIATPFPHELYAFRRPLADGTEWLTAVNISGKDLVVTVPAGFHAFLAGPGATLDAVTGRLRLPRQSWMLGAKGVPELVRQPRGAQRPEARFVPTYGSAHRAASCSARPVPAFLRGSVMYQIFTRMFTPEGTFAAARAKLPELRDLGVDIIYLTPHQLADDDPDPKFWSARQKQCRLGNPKNPYRQKDFFAVDPEYGTAADLKAFVDEAHRLGMKVMFDLVYFHCGPKAVFLKDHPDFVVRNPDGTPRLGEWAFPEMDVSKAAVREYLYANMTGFIKDYGVDGFRCDVADMLPVDFWEEGYRRCRALNPDVFMMCEGLKGDDQIEAFDLSYGFYTQWALVDLLAGKAPASLLRTAWQKAREDFPREFHWMRCFENHDFANVTPGQKRKEELYGAQANASMLATLFLLDGIPMLYNGQEIADASPQSIYSNRDHGGWHVDWSRAGDAKAVERRALVKRLCRLRHDNPALFDAPLVWHEVIPADKAYAFSRLLPGGKKLTLAVNVSGEAVEAAVDGERTLLGPRAFLLK